MLSAVILPPTYKKKTHCYKKDNNSECADTTSEQGDILLESSDIKFSFPELNNLECASYANFIL